MKKRESWKNAKLPEPRELVALLCKMSAREQAILLSSFLDSLLGDLIFKKLDADEKEAANFLGYDGDGRAPGASFGSRIQLAYLLSLIDANELKALRAVKSVRNIFAHRVICSFDDQEVIAKTKEIIDALDQAGDKYLEKGRERSTDEEWQQAKAKNIGLKDGRIGFFTGAAVILINHLKKMVESK